MLKLTLKEIEIMSKAEVEQIVDRVNDELYIAHQTAVLTGIATNNPRRFPRKAPQVKNITTPKKAAKPEDIYDRIWQIAGVFGQKLDEPTE